MPVVPLETPADLIAILSEGSTAFIFKHSTRCPTSARARDRVNAYADANPDVPVHRVLVIEHRPISLTITERLGVPHASPQVILVRDGRAVWNVSHLGVTAEALAVAWAG